MVTGPRVPGHEVAIIGSFRKYFAAMTNARDCCGAAGLAVSTPASGDVVDDSVTFVRLTTDDAGLADEAIQAVATNRIIRADAVYVVAPNGYVGRTTCWEVGRAMQAGRPVYFSEPPEDLPIRVPATHIIDPPGFAAVVKAGRHSWWDPDLTGPRSRGNPSRKVGG
jgi:hypothetical protein